MFLAVSYVQCLHFTVVPSVDLKFSSKCALDNSGVVNAQVQNLLLTTAGINTATTNLARM